VRALAGFDPDAMDRVRRWILRDALLAYEHQLRETAARDYRDALLRHAMLAPWAKDLKPPRMPPILSGAPS